MAADYGIAVVLLLVQTELNAAVDHQGVQFLEGTLVEEDVEALAGGEFAAAVLGLDTLLAAAQLR